MEQVIFIGGIVIIAVLFAFLVTRPKKDKKSKINNFSINDVAKMVTQTEGKKVNLSIAQVNEVLKVINTLTGGRFYKWVKENVN